MNDVERRKKIKNFIAYWENRVIGERKEYQNLRKAHRENDKQVMKIYNFKISHTDFTEEDCVASLMKLYKQVVKK